MSKTRINIFFAKRICATIKNGISNRFVKTWLFLFSVSMFAIQNVGIAQQSPKILSDSTEVAIMLDLARKSLNENQGDTAIVLAQKAYSFSIEHQQKWALVNSRLILARAYSMKKSYPKALSYYLKTLNEYRKKNNHNVQRLLNYEIGKMYYGWEVYDKALEHLLDANDIRRNKTSQHYNLNGILLTAETYVKLNKPDSAVFYYEVIVQEYYESENIASALATLKTIANVHKNSGNYKKAIEKQTEILNINRKTKNKNDEFATLNNIGYLYKRLSNNTKSIDYFRKAFELSSDNLNHQATALLNIGVMYQNEGDMDNAFTYFEKALSIKKTENNTAEIAKIHNLLASTYLQSKNLESAIECINSAEETGVRSKNKDVLQNIYKTASQIYHQAGAYQEALFYYQKYIILKNNLDRESRLKQTKALSKKLYIDKTEKEIKLYLAQEELQDLTLRKLVLEKEGSEKALALAKENEALLQKHLALEKSAANNKLQLIQRILEAEKKDREISELQKDKQIKEFRIKQQERLKTERDQKIKLLASSNRLLKQEKKLEHLNARRSKTQRQVMFAAFIVTFCILMMIIVNSVKRRKTNRLLRLQNTQITRQNEEVVEQRNILVKQNRMITDSMNYAEKIQSSVFAQKGISDIGLDYFVLFKPRDIVSGDFHTIHVVGEKVVVAVVDCTGHGIPGAMLSMLGNSSLNEIVAEKGVESASSVLDELRHKVKQALGQNTTRNSLASDGMDIALCVIDKNTLELQYAGAYNPLYIIRKGELTVIKADRQPIGIYPKERPFTNHKFQLQKGDRLYTFSDGFIDQMNNKGSKFLAKRFRPLLVSLNDKPLQSQKKILETAHENWRGKEKQTDDLIVMGIEV